MLVIFGHFNRSFYLFTLHTYQYKQRETHAYLRRVRSECCEVRAECVEGRGCRDGGNAADWHGGSEVDCRWGSAAGWRELQGRGSL